MTLEQIQLAHVKQDIFIARKEQLLQDHLLGVANITGILAEKIGLKEAGYIIGLLHDLGKYSEQFQQYLNAAIKANNANINPDIDEDEVDYKKLKGKIDHSTAGAQWIWQTLKDFNAAGHGEFCAQILALCIVSHHSGLIDCLKNNEVELRKINEFKRRINKLDEKTHLAECLEKVDDLIHQKMNTLNKKEFVHDFWNKICSLAKDVNNQQIEQFYLGMLTKFLFSCLIDADRTDSANPSTVYQKRATPWDSILEIFEKNIAKFKPVYDIDHVRFNISESCRQKAENKQGIYRLTVPTGGGKTLASLRYALHHAKKYNLDRIIYIIPYTSIIEQNAEAIRKILDQDSNDESWVLEHHSNLEPEQQTWHSKLASENWDAPIILTTMVQFLEVLFGGGTRGVRRLHQLANSILIFDEIQTLPIKCFHLFCNAINFLVAHTKTTVVLCTATQPSLDELKDKNKGQLDMSANHELVGDIDSVDKLFNNLNRVDIVYDSKPQGWSADDIVDLALKEFSINSSCLIIVNTKVWARKLYDLCRGAIPKEALFHLSTNQCAAHRKESLDLIRERLKNKLPVLCISTQLIEAGVDISVATVIRFLAGLDSIAQAAGRCNRHGELRDEKGNPKKGKVYVINPDVENIKALEEIKIGQEQTKRILHELKDSDTNLLHPEIMKRYFEYYFHERSPYMTYKVSAKQIGRDASLLELLSDNKNNGYSDGRTGKIPLLRHSFMTAGKFFKTIDAPTNSVIVPYGEGKNIINDLCSVAKDFDPKKYYTLLRKAQRYTVNVFPKDWEILNQEEAINEIQGEGIYFLSERYYSEEFGLATEPVELMSFQHC